MSLNVHTQYTHGTANNIETLIEWLSTLLKQSDRKFTLPTY